jgi:hypothetical protein
MWNQERKKPRFPFSSLWAHSCVEDSFESAGQSLPVSISVVDAQADAISFGQRSSG